MARHVGFTGVRSAGPHRRTARLRLWPALVATALLLAGCAGGTTTSGTGGGGASTSASVSSQARGLLPKRYRTSGTVTIGTEATYPPMEMMRSGQPVGVDPDLARAIAARLGLRANVVNTGFDGLIPGLRSGRFDLTMSSMGDVPDRRRQVDFVDYFEAGSVIVAATGNPKKIKTLADLCGKTVALVRGTTNLFLVQEQQPKCGSNPVKINLTSDSPISVLQIKSGRADATVVDYPAAIGYAQQSGGVEPVSRQYQNDRFGIGVAKGNTGLRDAVQAALKSLIADGSYRRILQRYRVTSGSYEKATINGSGS